MGAVRGARPPSQTAYFVALAGIVVLLIMLCCYFIYFCVRRVKELASQPLPEPVKSVRPPPPEPGTYPVQPGVRESATAMARLCQSTHTSAAHHRIRATSLPAPRVLPTSPGTPTSQIKSPSKTSQPTLVTSPIKIQKLSNSPYKTFQEKQIITSPTRHPLQQVTSPSKVQKLTTTPYKKKTVQLKQINSSPGKSQTLQHEDPMSPSKIQISQVIAPTSPSKTSHLTILPENTRQTSHPPVQINIEEAE